MTKKEADVIIEKLSESDNPDYPAAKTEEHEDGGFNLFESLPVEYRLKAVLTKDIVMGEGIVAYRYERNDTLEDGWFRSSAVTKIEEGDSDETLVSTRNSIYKITPNK
jgi:hypothetical protein